MQQDANQSGQETFVWHERGYLAYGISMFLILSFGFIGNVLTLLVLKQPEHRSRGVTPLMINVALADISIVLFGYPIAIQSTFRGELLERSACVWVAFINGTVGITSIFTLTQMVVMSYFGVKRVNTNTHRLSTHQVIFLIGSAWLYGSFCMLPPLLGWSRFVVTSSKISCCPDWAGKSGADISYNLLLVAFGFIFPLTVMIVCYYKIFSIVHRAVVPGNVAVRIRQRHSELKILRMTAMSVIAYSLSWSPYCVVSLAAVFTGNHVIESGEAEVPELLAKASVVYNPIVYTIMNNRFRATLLRILNVRRRSSLQRDLTIPSRVHSLRIDANCQNINKGCERQSHLLQVPSFETAVADNR